jgi:hypothetical protein
VPTRSSGVVNYFSLVVKSTEVACTDPFCAECLIAADFGAEIREEF